MGEPASPRGLPRGVGGPGEESRSDDIAAQAIEAQPVFGQIRPSRGQVRPWDRTARQEKTWRTLVLLDKMSASSGAEIKATAQKKAASFAGAWSRSKLQPQVRALPNVRHDGMMALESCEEGRLPSRRFT